MAKHTEVNYKVPEDMLRARLNVKAPATLDATAPSGDMPNFEQWSKEQVGFAPYWSPSEGAFFYGSLVAIDTRDPEFIRYQVKALARHQCQRGPVDGAEGVTVEAGEFFSVSVYEQLRPKFDEYLGLPFEIPVQAKALRSIDLKGGKTMWMWELRVSPETRKLLDAHRADERKAMMANTAERKAIQAAG